jgi:hypothetical protein
VARNNIVPEVIADVTAQIPASREEIRDKIREEGEKVAEYARTIAPVYHGGSRPDLQPGKFRDSIHYEDQHDINAMPAGMVISRSRIAHLLEFGTIHMHEIGTFAATAAAFGGTGPDSVDETGEAPGEGVIGPGVPAPPAAPEEGVMGLP